jgi:hypothetical protein
VLASADSTTGRGDRAFDWLRRRSRATRPETRRALGLDDAVLDASVATGRGALRALLLTVRDDASIREVLPRYAGRLATRAAHALWVIVAFQPSRGEVAIAAWSADQRPPRVAAVVVERRHPVDTGAETLRALSVAAGERDVLAHMRWVEILGRDSLTARFHGAGAVSALASSSPVGTQSQRHDAALLDASRLVFLAFLEAKGWLDGDRGFLVRHFDRCMANGGRFRDRVPVRCSSARSTRRSAGARERRVRSAACRFLNGGLFARTSVERALRGLSFPMTRTAPCSSTSSANTGFTAREETATWTAAVDPEMLGRAFESLMAPAAVGVRRVLHSFRSSNASRRRRSRHRVAR